MAKNKKQTNKYNDCWNSIGVWSSAANRCERLSQVIHCRNCDVFASAGREVLEQTPQSEYITEWQKAVARKENEIDSTLPGVMAFRIGAEWFAISAQSLQEVSEYRIVRRVPHNENKNIAGIVNIGGEVVVCYSLANFLEVDLPEDIGKASQRMMVVLYSGEKYIFPVSEVMGMTRYGEGDILPLPSTLGEEKTLYIDSVFLHDKKHIAILNIEEICQSIGRTAA